MAKRARRIGLLGGSFNPAHEGHLHISLEALKRLELDEVWWLVSPQNPLKSSADMADYKDRVASAQHFIDQHPALSLCEIEQQNGLQYTAHSLRFLAARYPQHQFVWLMGSDNLVQFHRWQQWRSIMQLMPVCILDRAPHSHAALRSPAALSFATCRLPENRAAQLIDAPVPRWCYLFIQRHKESATALRNKFGKNAFLR